MSHSRSPTRHAAGSSAGITRRELLLGGTALTLGAAAPRAFGQDTTTVEGVARRTIGDSEIIALLDGRIALQPELFAGASEEDIAALIAGDVVDGYINAFVVVSPNGTVMIDAGAGAAIGPTAGKLLARLEAAGIEPADIGTLYVTHLHPDHIGGLVGDGAFALPNAEMVLHERERAFWFDDEMMAQSGEEAAPFFLAARAAVDGFGERVTTFSGTTVPGPLEAMELFGHTPGHTGYTLADGDDTLLIWGDIVHAPAIQFPRPEVTIGFDVDPSTAEATRQRVLDMTATDGIAVGGMHLVFPALGTVTRSGDAYAFETQG